MYVVLVGICMYKNVINLWIPTSLPSTGHVRPIFHSIDNLTHLCIMGVGTAPPVSSGPKILKLNVWKAHHPFSVCTHLYHYLPQYH